MDSLFIKMDINILPIKTFVYPIGLIKAVKNYIGEKLYGGVIRG